MPLRICIWCDFLAILAIPGWNGSRSELLSLAIALFAPLQSRCIWDKYKELSHCDFLLSSLSLGKKHMFSWLQSLLK